MSRVQIEKSAEIWDDKDKSYSEETTLSLQAVREYILLEGRKYGDD